MNHFYLGLNIMVRISWKFGRIRLPGSSNYSCKWFSGKTYGYFVAELRFIIILFDLMSNNDCWQDIREVKNKELAVENFTRKKLLQ